MTSGAVGGPAIHYPIAATHLSHPIPSVLALPLHFSSRTKPRHIPNSPLSIPPLHELVGWGNRRPDRTLPTRASQVHSNLALFASVSKQRSEEKQRSTSCAPPSRWRPFLRGRCGRVLRLRVRCRAGGSGGDGEWEGKEEEEAPESLFAKELRRRGMEPGSAPSGEKAGAAEAEQGGRGGEAVRKRGVAAAAEFVKAAVGADGKRERSMALNSEGLEYFGPSFVHDASKTPVSPPPYIDPYELLEDERLSRPSPDAFYLGI